MQRPVITRAAPRFRPVETLWSPCKAASLLERNSLLHYGARLCLAEGLETTVEHAKQPGKSFTFGNAFAHKPKNLLRDTFSQLHRPSKKNCAFRVKQPKSTLQLPAAYHQPNSPKSPLTIFRPSCELLVSAPANFAKRPANKQSEAQAVYS